MNSFPKSNEAVNQYVLPIHKSKLVRIDTESSPAHMGKLANAVDLLAPEQTPVLAAADGTVTFVSNNSALGGPDISFWGYSNFIVIMHSYDEYTRYDHLAFGSSNVTVDQRVKAGQEIARVGMTGYTFTPHYIFKCLCGSVL